MSYPTRYLANKQALRVALLLVLILSLPTLMMIRWREDASALSPTMQVLSFLPGVSAEEIDERVALPLLEGLRHHLPPSQIRSVSYDGVSILTLLLPDDFSPLFLSQLERTLYAVRSTLPVEVEGPLLIPPQDEAVDAMIALTADGFTLRELEESATDLLNMLSTRDEIAHQQLLGRDASEWRANKGALAPLPIAYANGRPALLILLDLRDEIDPLRFGSQLETLLKVHQEVLPHGIEIEVIFLSADELRGSMNSYLHLLIQSLAVAVALIFFFIRKREGLMVAGLFAGSYLLFFLGLELSGASLTPAMAVGLMVGVGPIAAIHWLGLRCLKSHSRHTESAEKEDVLSAFWRRWGLGWFVIGVALLGGGLSFLSELQSLWGGTSALFSTLFIIFMIAVLLSMLGLPLFYRPQSSPLHDSYWGAQYQKLLRWAVKIRWVLYFMLVALLLLVIKGVQLFPIHPFSTEMGVVRRIELHAPQGTTLEEMTRLMSEVDDHLATQRIAATLPGGSDVATWATLVGQPVQGLDLRVLAHPSEPLERTHYAEIYIRYASESAARRGGEWFRTEIAANWPELTFQIENPRQTMACCPHYLFSVQGDNPVVISESVTRIKQRLYADPRVDHVRSDWEPMQRVERLKMRSGRWNQLPLPLEEALEKRTLCDLYDLKALWVSEVGGGREITLPEMMELSDRVESGVEFIPATVVREKGVMMAKLGVEFYPSVDPLQQQELVDSILLQERPYSHSSSLSSSLVVEAEPLFSSWSHYAQTHARVLFGLFWFLLTLFLVRYRSIKKALVLLFAPLSGTVGVVSAVALAGLSIGPMVLVAALLVMLFGVFAALAFAECQAERDQIGTDSRERCIEESGRQWVAPLLLAVVAVGSSAVLIGLGATAIWSPFALVLVSGMVAQGGLGALLLPVIYGRVCSASSDSTR